MSKQKTLKERIDAWFLEVEGSGIPIELGKIVEAEDAQRKEWAKRLREFDNLWVKNDAYVEVRRRLTSVITELEGSH